MKYLSKAFIIALLLLFTLSVSCATSGKSAGDLKAELKKPLIEKNTPIDKETGFFKTFYKNDPDKYFVVSGEEVIPLKDGYILLARIFDDKGPRSFAWVLRLDKEWNIVWEADIGKEAHDASLTRMITIDDKSLVLVGSIKRTSDDHWFPSIWIVRISLDDGEVEWDRSIRYGEETVGSDVKRTDKGVVVVGRIRVGDGWEHVDSALIAELSLDGKILWNKQLKYENWLDDILLFKDGFIASSNYWITRLDREGNVIWEKKLDGYDINKNQVMHLKPYDEESILLADSEGPSWIKKIRSDGSIEWTKGLDNLGLCNISNLWRLDEGGFVIVGETCKEDKKLIWTGLFNADGDLKVARNFLNKWHCSSGYHDVKMAIPVGEDKLIASGNEGIAEGDCQAGWIYKMKLDFGQGYQELKKEK